VTTTKHSATVWSIFVLHGSAYIEYTSHNFIVLAVCVPKIIKFGGDLTKF